MLIFTRPGVTERSMEPTKKVEGAQLPLRNVELIRWLAMDLTRGLPSV